jgi:hypothetical protein
MKEIKPMREYQVTITVVRPRKNLHTIYAYAEAEGSVYEALAAAQYELMGKIQEGGTKLPARGYRECSERDYTEFSKMRE